MFSRATTLITFLTVSVATEVELSACGEGAVEIAGQHRPHGQFPHLVPVAVAVDPHDADMVFAVGLVQKCHVLVLRC